MTDAPIRAHAFAILALILIFSLSSRLFPLSRRLLCFKLLFSRFGFLRPWLTREYRVSLFWLGFFDGGFWLDLEFMDFFFSFKDFCVCRDS